MGRSILLGIREQLQYIDRKAAGLCIRCGFEPTDGGKVECRNCGEESNKRSKARYAKRVREADAWEHGSEITLGLLRDTDGTWLALTRVESKSFKSRAAAEKWLARMGYRPDGTKF